MENDIKKMFELYKKCNGENISFDIASEDNVKHIYRYLQKIYHFDINSASPHNKIFLQYALEIFPELVYGNDIKENFDSVSKELNLIYDIYKKSDKTVLDPQKQEEEDYNKCKDVCEGHDRHMREMIKNNPELSKVLNNVYQRFIYLNTIISKETISRILQEKDLTRKNCEIIINKKKTLDNFSFQIKDVTNYNTEEQERCLLTLKKIVDSFIKQIDQVEELSKINDSYYLAYQEISKLIAVQKINKEIIQTISKSNISTINDYNSIKAQFSIDLDEINIKNKKDTKTNDLINKLNSKLTNLVAYYKVKINFQEYKLKKYKELKDKIVENNYTKEEVELNLESLLSIDNYDEFNKQYIIISDKLNLKLYKLKTIKDIKEKSSKLPENVVPQDINKVIDEINNCNSSIEIDNFKKPIIRRLDYSLEVNSYINEYLQQISNNPKYSFSIGDIKSELDSLRKYFHPLDTKFESFNMEFRIIKEKFKKKAANDLKNAEEKKEKLNQEFAKCYEEKIFITQKEEQVKKQIDDVKTFGEFSKLKNKIILSELKNQMYILVPRLTSIEEKLANEIKSLRQKDKKENNPFIIDFVPEEKLMAIKEKRARLNYIKQAQECFTTICEMFDRTENFNSMIIYPEAKYIKKEDNKESYNQALKQSVELINLDFENDELEKISVVVNKVYKELLLDKKSRDEEEKAFRDAVVEHRRKI